MAVFSRHVSILIFFLVVFKFSVIKSILGFHAEEDNSDEILDDISKDLINAYLRLAPFKCNYTQFLAHFDSTKLLSSVDKSVPGQKNFYCPKERFYCY